MKTKNKDLDVDYLGGLGSLTVEEEQALSAYLQHKRKLKKTAHVIHIEASASL